MVLKRLQTMSRQTISSAYITGNFRSEVAVGLICVFVSIGISFVPLAQVKAETGLLKSLMTIGLSLSGLIGIILLARACYFRSISALQRTVSDRSILMLRFLIVAAAWVGTAWYFSHGASLTGIRLTSGVIVGYAFSVGVLVYVAHIVAESGGRPKPSFRAYLVAIAVVAFLCLMTKSGQSFRSDDDTGSSDVGEPIGSPKDVAFLHFILYTAACGVGIATTRNRNPKLGGAKRDSNNNRL